MPNTENQPDAPESSTTGSVDTSAVARFANDPYLLLTRAVYVFATLGVLFVVFDIIAFPSSVRGQFVGIFNDSFGVLTGIGFILGILWIVNAV